MIVCTVFAKSVSTISNSNDLITIEFALTNTTLYLKYIWYGLLKIFAHHLLVGIIIIGIALLTQARFKTIFSLALFTIPLIKTMLNSIDQLEYKR